MSQTSNLNFKQLSSLKDKGTTFYVSLSDDNVLRSGAGKFVRECFDSIQSLNKLHGFTDRNFRLNEMEKPVIFAYSLFLKTYPRHSVPLAMRFFLINNNLVECFVGNPDDQENRMMAIKIFSGKVLA